MLPDRVSNLGPLTYESGALPIALRGLARQNMSQKKKFQGMCKLRNKICVHCLISLLCLSTPIYLHSRLGQYIYIVSDENMITMPLLFLHRNTLECLSIGTPITINLPFVPFDFMCPNI